jgi:hypothetical protein
MSYILFFSTILRELRVLRGFNSFMVRLRDNLIDVYGDS